MFYSILPISFVLLTCTCLFQEFVYRGKEYERLSDFSSRVLNNLPQAELMNKLTPPGEEVTESQGQCK